MREVLAPSGKGKWRSLFRQALGGQAEVSRFAQVHSEPRPHHGAERDRAKQRLQQGTFTRADPPGELLADTKRSAPLVEALAEPGCFCRRYPLGRQSGLQPFLPTCPRDELRSA